MQETIRIKWEGPYSFKEVIEDRMFNSEAMDFGVYQLYGCHPVYGSNVLLYIGKAQDQTFSKRISQHGLEYNEDYKNIQIYLGRIYNDNDIDANTRGDRTWDELISRAEKMLIYSHEPAKNSSNIHTASKNNKELEVLKKTRVLNYGLYRNLMPEVSGDIWIKEYDDWSLFGEE